jgi:hypothetical protein
VHRLEERRQRDEWRWRRGGAALQERSHDFIRVQIVNPKTTRTKPQRRQPPTLKRFRGVRGEIGRHGDA